MQVYYEELTYKCEDVLDKGEKGDGKVRGRFGGYLRLGRSIFMSACRN